MVWLNISNDNFLHQISHNPLLRFSGCFLSRYSTVYTLLERCTSTITDRTPRKSHDKTLKPFRISEGNDSDSPREPYCPCIKLTFLSLLIMYTFSMQKKWTKICINNCLLRSYLAEWNICDFYTLLVSFKPKKERWLILWTSYLILYTKNLTQNTNTQIPWDENITQREV